MPQPFNSSVMTDSGAALLTKAQAGECKIQFTQVAIGDGEYTDEEKTTDALKVKTGLKDEKNSYDISSLKIYNEHCVEVTAVISNQDPDTGANIVDEGYYINEMGLFAKEADGSDDTGILYSIAVVAVEQGDFLPSYSGVNSAQIIQNFFVAVDNSADIVIDIDNTYVTVNRLYDDIYPIGSIYMSVNAVDPANLFGGTWERLKDAFLLAAGDSHEAGETGGEEAVALTAEQMPEHVHNIPPLDGTAASAGGHTHSYTGGSVKCMAASLSTGAVTCFEVASATTGSAGSHTHNVTTVAKDSDSAGSGEEHDNMPPYLAVYMWKRVA